MASTAPAVSESPSRTLDIEAVLEDFPTLHQKVHGQPLTYLDNAATAQTPKPVIDAITRFYTEECSNIHRGVHWLSGRATKAYEDARRSVQKFIGAQDAHEVVFLRGTTEAVNLVAQTFGRSRVKEGDNVLITAMEHHSNIVPWQMLCDEVGAELRIIPIDDQGDLILDELDSLLNARTRLLAISHISNAIGTINPIKDIIARAHQKDVPVLVDGAQAVPHVPVDVQDLDCDFYAFSGHKLYGPMGVGALYIKKDILESLPPYQGGGGMIRQVSFEGTTFASGAERFEAGTPNVVGAIGLGAAAEYIQAIGFDRIIEHEDSLIEYAQERLATVKGLRRIGHPKDFVAVYSMVLDGVHPHDLGTILDRQGVAIRAGHHCAQPLMRHFKVPATARASFGIYNTRQDIDALVDALNHARELFQL